MCAVLRMLGENFKVSSVNDVLLACYLMLPIIKSFNEDPEKFYPQFYKLIVLPKTVTKISLVTVIFSLVLKLQIT